MVAIKYVILAGGKQDSACDYTVKRNDYMLVRKIFCISSTTYKLFRDDVLLIGSVIYFPSAHDFS